MKVKSSKKTYNKHHVKRDPNTLLFLTNKEGNPIAGDFIRDTRITDSVAEELNSNSGASGYVWVEDKSAEIEEEKLKAEKIKKEQLEKELAKKKEKEKIEAERKKLADQNKESDPELDKLKAEAKELGIKSAHVMKKETLIEKINESKDK